MGKTLTKNEARKIIKNKKISEKVLGQSPLLSSDPYVVAEKLGNDLTI